MQRAAIYARVSSVAQRDKHTIDGQLRVLRTFIEGQGWALVETYVDDGFSAKTGKGLDDRAGFRALLAGAKRAAFDVVVVVAIDRLTRTEDMLEQAEVLAPFQRAGVNIVTPATGTLDLRTMFGRLWTVMQAFVGAEENRVRGERIKAGKVRAIAENRKPAGPTPFGLAYDRARGEWAIDEEAAELVREMVRRVAAGETCVRVADDFIRRDVRAPGRGKAWTRATVYRLVHNRYSCGTWIVNKKTGAAIAVPRIVEDEEWNAAQAALRKAQRRGLNRTQHVYLLQGLATCGHCNEPIVIRSAVTYYNAARELREHPSAYLCRGRMAKPRTCDAPIIHTKALDSRVWEKLSERLDHPDLIGELANVDAEHASDLRDWKSDIDVHKAHLTRLTRVETGITTRYRHGKLGEETYDTELTALHRERKMVLEQLSTAERAAGSTMTQQQRLRAAGVTVAMLRGALPKAAPDQRRALLRELAREVVLKDGQAHLDLRIVRRAKAAYPGVAPLAVVNTTGCDSHHGAGLRVQLVA